MKSTKNTIGCTRIKYPEKRCITTNYEMYNYVNVQYRNIYNYLRSFPIIGKYFRSSIFKPCFKDSDIDIYHSFNDVCQTDKKWVVTFETMLPRFLDLMNSHSTNEELVFSYNKTVHKWLLRIAKENCIGVISLSKSALAIQKEVLSSYPDVKQVILSKTKVIYPPQEVLATRDIILSKDLSCINFIFIGSDFYRKGGGEVILAFDKITSLDKYRGKVSLTIVGDLNNKHNYVHKGFQDTELFFIEIESIIRRNNSIKHFSNVGNEKLMKMIRSHHVGLLPTWGDTFGYSVLEFQASGCPVISTNVRALPEINNNDIGWVIETENNAFGEIVIESFKSKSEYRDIIVDGVYKAVLEILDNKNLIYKKGLRSIESIEQHHSISKYNRDIFGIYSA